MNKASLRASISFLALAILFSTATTQAATRAHIHGKGDNACTLIPPNNLRFAPGLNASGISEKTFHQVIDLVEKIYAPIVEAKGGKLVVERNWDDDTVNAYASRSGNTWHVAMFGGLARHPETTPDAFATVVCHELGHHLGGVPKKFSNPWASAEGQSDYFGTLKCMRRVLAKIDNWETLRRQFNADDIDPLVAERCKIGQGSSKQEFAICVRGAMGGKALARLLASLGREPMPEFNTPDRTVVTKTDVNHPEAQCRLDTYFAGAVCNVSHETDVSDTDATVGVCNPKTLEEMRRARTRIERLAEAGNAFGVRPACWFAGGAKPQLRMSPLASAR